MVCQILGVCEPAEMSGVSTTSTTTFKTDVTSKVLPGDKSGLPLEIWQIIFSYLSVRDLCCVARVSKIWYDLSLSIDQTRWKELYLTCKEWRHPYWPLSTHLEPSSWKLAYRSQHLSTRFWNHGSCQAQRAGCITLLKRSRDRQVLEVGPGLQYQTLKSAFAVASEYDRILVHPGIYDEQLEMSLRVPFELVGIGELGSVILVVCLEHIAVTGRLSNLVLRAPWFTNFTLKVMSGFLQVDNCIMEEGVICVASPAACHIQFCSFRHSAIILQHVSISIIRNCEFSQGDNANIVLEGYPKEEKSWAYPHLCQQMDAIFNHRQPLGLKHLLKATNSTTSTLHSNFTRKSFISSTIKSLGTLTRSRAGSQDAEFARAGTAVNGMNLNSHMPSIGVVNGSGVSQVAVNNHTVGQMPESDKLQESIHSFASGSDGNAEGVNRYIVCTYCTKTDNHNVKSTNSDSIDPLHGQQHRCAKCLLVASTKLDKQEASYANNSATGIHHHHVHDNSHAAEWLEINDERKTWKIEGEDSKYCTLKNPGFITEKQEHILGISKKTSAKSQGSNKLYENRPSPKESIWNGPEADSEGVNGPQSSGSENSHSKGKAHKVYAAVHSGDKNSEHNTGHCANRISDIQECRGVVRAFTGLPQCESSALADKMDVTNGNSRTLNSAVLKNYNTCSQRSSHPQDSKPTPYSAPVRAQMSNSSNPQGLENRRPSSEGLLAPQQAATEGEQEERRSQRSSHGSRHEESSSSDGEEEEDLSILNDLESVGSSHGHSDPDNDSSSSSEEDVRGDEYFRADSDYDCSDAEESVIMLPHLRLKHLEASLSANAVNADVDSIFSNTSQPVTMSAYQEEGVMSHIRKVRGCLIHQCRMMHSKGGVMVSLQAHAVVSGCEISNVGYGIRCIQNSRVVVLKNRIHHCQTSGIFMRLAASGLIAGNEIHSNNEAGIDIRKTADPIVRHNQIHHGKRSGVVVLGSGRGQIHSNNIYSNTEAGIYILYGGNPTVSENHIYDGKAAGVAVNEGGRGFIFDNTISSNQWGGVDIRHGSCPMVSRNTITNGLGDGIVIGDQGQGIIENNIISDNAGCGLWLMSASRPYIYGNQICNNGDTGVMMVNKTDVQHEGKHLLPARTGSVDQLSRSLMVMGSLLVDTPVPRPKCTHTTLQHNNIYHNAGQGVAVELGDQVDISYNAIYANHQDGVWIHQEAPLILSGNSISNNCRNGVVTSLTSSMEINGNGIYDNQDCGIVCSGKVDISENDVVGNQAGGIIIDDDSVCKINGNRIQVDFGPAVKVSTAAIDVRIEGNKIFHSGKEDVLDLSRQAVIDDNEITKPASGPKRTPLSAECNSESTFNKSIFLCDPPARPAIHLPSPPSDLPPHNLWAISKVMSPADDICQQGSKLCSVL